MPNQPSSYKKLFSRFSTTNDKIEKDVIEKIKNDYEKYHKHDLKMFEDIFVMNEIVCPICNSKKIKVHGYDKNRIKRFKCNDCGKTFNRFTNSLFGSNKINLSAWFVFLECLLSGTSTSAACLAAKISLITGSRWLKRIFTVLKNYQNNIKLDSTAYIDETYIHVDSSKIEYKDEIGKIKKVLKEPRGISRNKICILIATDSKNSFAEIVGTGRPSRIKNYEICKRHLKSNSLMIGDMDTSLTYAASLLNIKRKQYKSNTKEAYKILEPIDQLCNRFKFFINKHRGFLKEELQDYINLFIFIENEKYKYADLYLVTKRLLELLFTYKKANP